MQVKSEALQTTASCYHSLHRDMQFLENIWTTDAVGQMDYKGQRCSQRESDHK